MGPVERARCQISVPPKEPMYIYQRKVLVGLGWVVSRSDSQRFFFEEFGLRLI